MSRSATTINLDAYPELLTANDLANLLRLHRITISKMHTAGKLPMPRVIGCAQRWAKEEIRAWWEAGCPDRSTWESGAAAG